VCLVNSCCRVFCCDPVWCVGYFNRAVYIFCKMWPFTVSSSVQVGGSFNWTVTKCHDTPCRIVLLANTSFYGSCVLMSKRLPCWRVIYLSWFVTSRCICKESTKIVAMWLTVWCRYRMFSFADPTGKRTAWVSLRNCLYMLPLGLFAYNCKY
jgi:hypothetical protein